MTVTYPERLYAAKKTTWQWIPTVAAPATGISAAEFNAGFAIQCSFDADALQYTVSAESQESQRYCDQYATQTPGRKTLQIPDVDVYVSPQAPTSVDYKLATAWIPEPSGYLALRANIDPATTGVAAQIVSFYVPVKILSLMLKAPNPSDPGDVFKWRFSILPQGDPYVNKAITA